jgi:hypothetical protein
MYAREFLSTLQLDLRRTLDESISSEKASEVSAHICGRASKRDTHTSGLWPDGDFSFRTRDSGEKAEVLKNYRFENNKRMAKAQSEAWYQVFWIFFFRVVKKFCHRRAGKKTCLELRGGEATECHFADTFSNIKKL